MSSLFQLRPAEAKDRNFILNSWLRRYRDAISARLVTDAVYYRIQHEVITKILDRPNLLTVVACNPEDPMQIYGYLVAEVLDDLLLVHWTYVKGPFRRFGVAKAMLAQLPAAGKVQHTHRTHLLRFLDPKEISTYNPCYIWSLI